ncbi:MAG: YdeI/OmpD-associated family protein [Bacteroidota bacterium]
METHRDDGFPVFIPETPHAWRAYLARHHNQLMNTWLVLLKKNSGRINLTYEQARDIGLCFGWIDSKSNKRDSDSYYLFFARRNPKSNWSKVNKDRITALSAAGEMAAPGLAMVALAKSSGTWDALNDVDNLIVPEDLATALDAAGPLASKNWDNFPPSIRRGILEWIFNAKRPHTRAKRIQETATMAAKNERANQYRK